MKNRRRGQTLIIALAILFLLILLGGTFIVMIVRNMQRVARSGETDDSLALALAGLKHAAQQFKTSQVGADWRPQVSESLWRTPSVPAGISVPYTPLPVPPYATPYHPADLNQDGKFDGAELRQMDPDAEWLSDDGNFVRPYVRFPARGGRFLLRVTYLPHFNSTSAAAEGAGVADEFDSNSGMIHIESIGRPGEFKADDPTFFRGAQPQIAPNAPLPLDTGPSRKVEAWVPVGLADQLWWITDAAGERGPADMGVPALRAPGFDPRYASALPAADDPNLVEYPTILEGGVRSNVDLLFHGRTLIRIHPARGEGIYVKGKIRFAPRSKNALGYNPAVPNLRVQAVDDSGDTAAGGPPPTFPKDDQNDNPFDDSLLADVPEGESGTPAFNPIQMLNQGGTLRQFVRDEEFSRGASGNVSATTREISPPVLDQIDPVTGVMRWLELTRDSGETIRVIDDNPNTAAVETRLVNTGWYGLTSIAAASGAPANWKARGLYVDNFGDIQYPNDRKAVKDEWLQRGASDVRRRGWIGDYYVPSVVEKNTVHPITDVYLTLAGGRPVIRVTRFDMDQRQLNIQPDTGRQRMFYDITAVSGGSAALSPVGQSRDFDYPENGVMYAEGSIRVHGVIGSARQLTIVSGGSIYIEGNLVKPRVADAGGNLAGDPRSAVALLAHDYVTLNPTVFTRIRTGEDVLVEADTFGPTGEPTNYHFGVPPGSDLDFTFGAAEVLYPYSNSGKFSPLAHGFLHLKHTAVQDAVTSETAVNLYQPALPSTSPAPGWPYSGGYQYDFGSFPPPGGPWTALAQPFYLFDQWSAGQNPRNYAVSNYQTVAGSPANYERKTFLLPTIGGAGGGGGGGVPLQPGDEATFRMLVGYRGGQMEPNAQPYWLSRVAVLPDDQPLPIKVEAVMYAYTGSWFVIPPPFFNDNPQDTRANFLVAGQRPAGTIPNRDTGGTEGRIHPFFDEPLNIDIEIVGSISEDMPAEPQEKAKWMSHLWLFDKNYDAETFPGFNNSGGGLQPRPPFAPNIRYRYDPMYRRLVRVRDPRTGAEEIAWAGPTGAPPPFGLRAWTTVVNDIKAKKDSYAELLPIFPKLPAGSLIYEGNSL